MKWQFWKWLFRGLSHRPGYTQLADRWIFVHMITGSAIAIVSDVPLHEAAHTVLLPLAGIFIGLSFAWIGSAQALMQEKEMEKLAKHHPDGIETYVYTFQLAILIILVTLAAWGLAGLKVFDSISCKHPVLHFKLEAILYFLSSLTLRECWHVVMASQLMVILRSRFDRHK